MTDEAIMGSEGCVRVSVIVHTACPGCAGCGEITRYTPKSLLAVFRCDACGGTGVVGTCATCKRPAYWQECPTGGWWIHFTHPDDHHDAEVADAEVAS